VLLLGGAGLIGTPAARALLRRGHAVAVLSRGSRPAPEGAAVLRADRADAASLAAALSGSRWDLVVDLVAFRGGDVDRLLDVPGLAIGRYVPISSGQVYLVGCDPRPPFREEDAEQPAAPEPAEGTRDHGNWVYGTGKREMEAAVARAVRERGLAATILRLPVVHGAGDTTRRLWAYLERMRDGGPLLLPGGGEQPVRFVWADDVARALVAIAEGPAPPAAAYNLAQPDEPPLRALLESAARCLGRPVRFVECAWAETEAAGIGHSVSPFSGRWCSRPDPARAARDLGFVGTPSDAWMREVVRAHLEEPAPESHEGYASRALELAFAAAR
jgi:nucleoside-diphosphate-sugar epimerase